MPQLINSFRWPLALVAGLLWCGPAWGQTCVPAGLTETNVGSDKVTSVRCKAASLVDTNVGSDTVTAIKCKATSLVDTNVGSDTVVIIKCKAVSLVDTNVGSDTVTRVGFSGRSPTLTEIMNGSDAVAVVLNHSANQPETHVTVDSLLVTACHALLEGLTTTDSLTVHRNGVAALAETRPTADTVARSVSRSFVENLTTSAAVTAGKIGFISINVNDALTVSDSLAGVAAGSGALTETHATTGNLSIHRDLFASSQLAVDGFDRADGLLGFPWTSFVGLDAGQISNDAWTASSVSNNSFGLYDGGVGWSRSQFSQATIVNFTPGSGYASLQVLGNKIGSPGDCYQLILDGVFQNAGIKPFPTSMFVHLFRCNRTLSGGYLATGPVLDDLRSGDVFRIQVVGNVITAYRNGQFLWSYTDTNSYTVPDQGPGFPPPGNLPGLGASVVSGISSDIVWDDWSGGSFGLADALITSDSVLISVVHVARMNESKPTTDQLSVSGAGHTSISISENLTTVGSVAVTVSLNRSVTEIGFALGSVSIQRGAVAVLPELINGLSSLSAVRHKEARSPVAEQVTAIDALSIVGPGLVSMTNSSIVVDGVVARVGKRRFVVVESQ